MYRYRVNAVLVNLALYTAYLLRIIMQESADNCPTNFFVPYKTSSLVINDRKKCVSIIGEFKDHKKNLKVGLLGKIEYFA